MAGRGENITASLPARLTHGAVMLARPVSMATDVKAARGNGCSGALPFLAMVTVTGAEYIVISAPSQQQPHSEVFHLSVFIVRATHHASGRRIKAEIINAGKGSEREKIIRWRQHPPGVVLEEHW